MLINKRKQEKVQKRTYIIVATTYDFQLIQTAVTWCIKEMERAQWSSIIFMSCQGKCKTSLSMAHNSNKVNRLLF